MRYIAASEYERVLVQHKDGTWGRLRECLDGRHQHVVVYVTNQRDVCSEETWRVCEVVASLKTKYP